MSKYLHIVVPCSRDASVGAFAQHLMAFFRQGTAFQNTKYFMTFVRQEGQGPLNPGALKNAGFLLGAQHADYTCFNDLACRPVWADYSWNDAPASLVWSEFPRTEPDADPPSPALKACRRAMSVLLVPNETHLLVDGYSNAQMGREACADDLRERYQIAGAAVQQRRGSFLLSTDAPGVAALSGQAIRAGSQTEQPRDGLSTLAFEISHRQVLASHEFRGIPQHHVVTIRLGTAIAEATAASISPTENGASGWMSRVLQQWLVSAVRQKTR